jgi:hypothetical protein
VRRALYGAFAVLAFAGACVSGQRGHLSPGIRDQNRLEADELVSLGPNASMFEVIERLRHRWMETRSNDVAVPEATDQIGVYEGDQLLGGLNELRFVQARNVASARFVGPREAAALFGPGHASGVIVLELK